ncbi:MAG: coenzyme F420-0:L-glutamate ligase [Caldilineales bacterium]|nr:coenzyme F420-0:L-glutamate ligase [Caldilineales bacterium]MDW8317602.1 coenzyme F420-0:L-glutamate ligase [Anaerolineae bacterium]
MPLVPRIELVAIPGLPRVRPGDDLPGLLIAAAQAAGLAFQDGDVLAVAQKVVSKAEGRLVRLADVTPSERALALAGQAQKDPRVVQLILEESTEVLRVRPGAVIVEHRLGFVCANAGVDQSNVLGDDRWALLLPADPDASAQRLVERVREATGACIAALIVDSHGRAWRLGTVGVAIGVAGLRPVTDLRGHLDLTGRPLQTTEVGTADEIAAAASLLMGQADEGTPAVIVRGARYVAGPGRLGELLRPRSQDLFR